MIGAFSVSVVSSAYVVLLGSLSTSVSSGVVSASGRLAAS